MGYNRIIVLWQTVLVLLPTSDPIAWESCLPFSSLPGNLQNVNKTQTVLGSLMEAPGNPGDISGNTWD